MFTRSVRSSRGIVPSIPAYVPGEELAHLQLGTRFSCGHSYAVSDENLTSLYVVINWGLFLGCHFAEVHRNHVLLYGI